jgi:anaerobic selenocysteine-containing dehydrogenase
LIRYKEGGRLVPATWDEAIRFTAEHLDKIVAEHGNNSLAVLGSPRLTNESLYCLRKFATEVVETENYAVSDAFSLSPFFENLGGELATHRDIRFAKTIVLIGGEPEELQPLTGKQIRQAVRNGGAKLIIINSRPIRLREQASSFVHIRPGSENAAVLALADSQNGALAASKMGTDSNALEAVRESIQDTQGDLIFMFGGELSAAAQSVVAQFPYLFGDEGRRVLLHPLPLFNNSVGAHDMMGSEAKSPVDLFKAAGKSIRAMIVAGDQRIVEIGGDDVETEAPEFMVLFEHFLTAVSEYARVVFPAASYAEVDGTFTNNDGFVQRVRQAIEPVHQSLPDWMIVARLAKELGVDFGFERSASAVFREIGERVPAYAGLRYPLLKDESQPVQVKHAVAPQKELADVLGGIRKQVEALSDDGEKIHDTPAVGHELFKLGALTDKVPQFRLLAAGNPTPETFAISPLYQITVDEKLKRETAIA